MVLDAMHVLQQKAAAAAKKKEAAENNSKKRKKKRNRTKHEYRQQTIILKALKKKLQRFMHQIICEDDTIPGSPCLKKPDLLFFIWLLSENLSQVEIDETNKYSWGGTGYREHEVILL